MTRTALILAALLLPAACNHTPTMQEMAASCAASGYASGTEGGFACLQLAVSRQQVADAAYRARMAAIGAQLGEMGRRAQAQPQSTFTPAPRFRTSCRPDPFTGGFTCN